jgi:hypothetical protein
MNFLECLDDLINKHKKFLVFMVTHATHWFQGFISTTLKEYKKSLVKEKINK